MKRSYSSDLAAIEAHPGEPLVEHLWSVAELAEQTAAALPRSGPAGREALRRAARIVGASHDLAKATSYFQAHLRGQKVNRTLSSHAHTSALFGYLWARDELPGLEPDPLLREFLPLAVYLTILRHHGSLKRAYAEVSPDVGDQSLVEKQWAALRQPAFDELLALVGAPWNSAELSERVTRFWADNESRRWRRLLDRVARAKDGRFYVAENLLYSLLIDADRLQTAFSGEAPVGGRLAVPSNLVDAYRARQEWHAEAGGIAALRERLHAEVTATVDALNLDHHFYSLTAPTGLGKTVTAVSWLLRLRERVARERGFVPRVVYCLPFLSIIDQNAAVLRDLLDQPRSDVLVVHHHLGDSRYAATDTELADDLDTDASRLLIEGWQSEIVVTTFVQLFAILVNNRSRPLMRLSRLAGAIVVLDEVQTLPARYWSLFEALARELAESLGTTFVLMTATQPALLAAEHARELVPNPSHYFAQMRRITLRNETAEPIELASLAEKVIDLAQAQPEQSIGVVVNTTGTAWDLCATLVDSLAASHEIVFLSSLVAPIDRLAHVTRAKAVVSVAREGKEGKSLLLVSTQVIEAGVDLDLDELFRDIAPLDSIVQAAGRCNRNGALPDGGVVHLVRLVGANGHGYAEWVYDRVLVDATREVLAGRSEIEEPDLAPLVERYFRLLRDRVSTEASENVLSAVQTLRYTGEGNPSGSDVAIADFNLIENDQPRADVFLQLDDEAVSAWQDFQAARGIANRYDRLRRYSEIRPRLAPYVVSVPRNLLAANLPFLDGESYVVYRGEIDHYYDRETGWKRVTASYQTW